MLLSRFEATFTVNKRVTFLTNSFYRCHAISTSVKWVWLTRGKERNALLYPVHGSQMWHCNWGKHVWAIPTILSFIQVPLNSPNNNKSAPINKWYFWLIYFHFRTHSFQIDYHKVILDSVSFPHPSQSRRMTQKVFFFKADKKAREHKANRFFINHFTSNWNRFSTKRQKKKTMKINFFYFPSVDDSFFAWFRKESAPDIRLIVGIPTTVKIFSGYFSFDTCSDLSQFREK